MQNDLIVGFSLINVYENKLLSHSSCSAGLLCDLDGVSNDDLARFPLVFIDTTGQEEAEMDDGDSKFNNQEADLAVKHISALIECGVSAMDIGVISPYSAQTRRIRNILKEKWPQVVCSSIDGFQGREKQVIILSLVRCNDTGTVGFLESINRLNVAMTRAKRHLCVIGNAQTLARDATLKSLVAYLEDKAELLWYD